jgi:hypothetical protein
MNQMFRSLFFLIIPLIFTIFINSVHAQKSDWAVFLLHNNSRLEINKSSVTKVQNSIVFDGYTKIQIPDGVAFHSRDRYVASCNGKSFALLGTSQIASAEVEDGVWLPWVRDTSSLSNITSLVMDAELKNHYWFVNQSLVEKIQAWCKGSPKGLKNIEAAIASSGANDGGLEARVLLLDSIKSNPKYREIWSATYVVDKNPIMTKDDSTGEKIQIRIDDKPQYSYRVTEKSNSRGRFRFQCSERKIVLVQSVEYSKNGAVTDSLSLTEAQVNKNWSEVVPRSIGEAMLEFVCAL